MEQNLHTTWGVRRSCSTRCWQRTRVSARSATPKTTRWPRAFVDSFKTELIADRVGRTRSQLELAIVEWVAWFNTERLHGALGDIPPAELEHRYARQTPTRITL